ncbi:MAG: hypothetical protein GY910_22905 [bacterium]|nr:hypothetical protein [Deltaproteobacteria bacterium]MCP4907832.1 hypothetical protein [bacterium]
MLRKIRNAIEKTRLQRDCPEQIAPAVKSMDAIGLVFGRGDKTMLRKMKASALGRKLLDERHDILALISDRDSLRSLPEGSLGREYCRFAEESELYPEVLARIVREARAETGGFVPESMPEAAYLHDRFRDLHDLWHTLTGYGTDMAGEWGIIAFQCSQVDYRSMQIMAFPNVVRNAIPRRPDLIATWFRARRRGKRTRFLLAQDWDRLLPMPLEEVRRELGVEPLGAAYRTWNYPASAPAHAES